MRTLDEDASNVSVDQVEKLNLGVGKRGWGPGWKLLASPTHMACFPCFFCDSLLLPLSKFIFPCGSLCLSCGICYSGIRLFCSELCILGEISQLKVISTQRRLEFRKGGKLKGFTGSASGRESICQGRRCERPEKPGLGPGRGDP